MTTIRNVQAEVEAKGVIVGRTCSAVLLVLSVAALAACSSSGTGVASTSAPPGTAGATGQVGGSGGGGPTGAGQGLGGGVAPTFGKIAEISGNTFQVQSATAQTAVKVTPKTVYTERATTSASAVQVGQCIVAAAAPPASGTSSSAVASPGASRTTPTTLAAATVLISTPVKGSCARGGVGRGVGTGTGPRTGSFPTGARPSGAPTAGGGRFNRIAAALSGKVTAVDGDTITVLVTPRRPAGQSSATPTSSTVTTTPATVFSRTVAATKAALKVGLCAQALGAAGSTRGSHGDAGEPQSAGRRAVPWRIRIRPALMSGSRTARRARLRRRRRATVVTVTSIALAGAGGIAWAVTRSSQPIYRLASVRTATVQQTVTTTGTVSTVNQASPAFSIGGVVTSVRVRVGSQVRAGQTLATLDRSSLDQAVQSAQAAAARASQTLAVDEAAQALTSATSDSPTTSSTGNIAVRDTTIRTPSSRPAARGNVPTAVPSSSAATSSPNSRRTSGAGAGPGSTALTPLIAAVGAAQVKVTGDQHSLDLDGDVAAADRTVLAERSACQAILGVTTAPTPSPSSSPAAWSSSRPKAPAPSDIAPSDPVPSLITTTPPGSGVSGEMTSCQSSIDAVRAEFRAHRAIGHRLPPGGRNRTRPSGPSSAAGRHVTDWPRHRISRRGTSHRQPNRWGPLPARDTIRRSTGLRACRHGHDQISRQHRRFENGQDGRRWFRDGRFADRIKRHGRRDHRRAARCRSEGDRCG